MLNVSIFTPSHNPKYLSELYESIKDQDFYEWVILAQNIAVPDFKDLRVKVVEYKTEQPETNIGTLKYTACLNCTGDIFVEVDHDDLLMPNAIEEIKKAFEEDIDVGFIYSNAANFRNNFEKDNRFNMAHGWVYRDIKYKEFIIEEHVSFEATPASVSRIWYAPNHVRAWRKDAYFKAGGYNKDLKVLDDQDLIMRTYLVTKFKHIDKCLYLYRIDGNNSYLKYNSEIQSGTMRMYDENIEKLALKWAIDNKLLSINLGGRINRQADYVSVDLKEADVNCDLNNKWPFEDNSVGIVRAYDVIEHLKDPIHTMKELYRVLVPGGYAFIFVPSTDGRGAWQDPTHISYYNENSFLYYTVDRWAKYIDTPVRFQELRRYTTQKNDIDICWVVCHLMKLTDGMKRPPGIINI